MSDKTILDCVVDAYKEYWTFLGSMRGINNVSGKICRLEGDVSVTYFVTLDENSIEAELADMADKIKAQESNNEFIVIPELYTTNIEDAIARNSHFKLGHSYGMAKELSHEGYGKQEDKELNIFRVNDRVHLKICGAILNAGFEYDLFAFTHYLDAFNNHKIRFYLAECKGLPIGACMSMYGKDYVEIVWIGTLKGYRKKGIATKVMQMAEMDALRAGKTLSILTCGQENRKTYEGMGYTQRCTLLSITYQPEMQSPD